MEIKTGFTKGEWYLGLNGQILVKTGSNHTPICQMPFSSVREADAMPEAHANAHLIAASPKLYNAGKHIENILARVRQPEFQQSRHTDDMILGALKQLHKALAQAESR